VLRGEGTVCIDSGEYSLDSSVLKAGTVTRQVVSRIYLDHNATTPLDPVVRNTMLNSMKEDFGNPSGIYREGKSARFALDSARRRIAQLLNCTARRIIFTGGGSEANNHVLKGLAFACRSSKNHIITSTIEHPSVIETCKWLEKFGYHVTHLPVDSSGRVNPEDLLRAIREKTFLVSIMTANNETGSIQPITELARITREHGILFHTDATQAVGKIPVDVEALGIDLLTLSGHKLYGPKGIGSLYVKKGVILENLIHGGSQESGLRAGTENVVGIIGLGKAAELAEQRLPEMNRIRMLRDLLEKGIQKIVTGAKLNGHARERLPNTLNMCLPGFRGESLVLAMDQRGVSLSSGSACRSGSPKPSHAPQKRKLTGPFLSWRT
jgi:cysteine sulfinate desulfinase/cysteine desulfurase-like protein